MVRTLHPAAASRLVSSLALALALVVVALLCGCAGDLPPTAETAPSAGTGEARVEWALAIHGGAGVTRRSVGEREGEYRMALEKVLMRGREMLAAGSPSLDVVEELVQRMEDDPLFNAGRGAVFTSEGTNELDAAIMDGRDLSCGAVSGIKTVKNPIRLARGVMEKSRHVFLVGAGAEAFATELGLEKVDPEYFFVQDRYDSWQRAVESEKSRLEGSAGGDDRGTVGAVALDKDGNLAAATSTGGLTNKRFGRVGDVPVIGAGTYASNKSAAVSCTGVGEQFIRNTVAREVAALMEYRDLAVQEAADTIIEGRLEPNDGGLIAVAHDGSIAISFNTEGMFHGAADAKGRFEVGVFHEEPAADSAPATSGT